MLRPTVALYAKPDGVSIRLLEILISNFCEVVVLTSEKKSWGKAVAHISQQNLFKLVDTGKEFAEFNYLILINLDLAFSPQEIIEIARMGAAQGAKILTILPFVTESQKAWQERERARGAIQKKIPEAGTILAGELFGPRYSGNDKNFITRNITSAVLKHEAEGEDTVSLFPTPIDPFCRYLARNVFSFGPYGKEIAVYSEEISALDFLGLLKESFGEISYIPPKGERQEVLGVKRLRLGGETRHAVKETISYLEKSEPAELVSSKRKNNFYFLKLGAAVGVIILFLSPFFLAAGGAVFGLISVNSLKKGKIDSGRKNLAFAKFSLNNSEKFFSVFARIPVVSPAYKLFVGPTRVLSLSAQAGIEAIDAAGKLKELADFALGDEIYDPEPVVRRISSSLDALYERMSFLESELGSLPSGQRRLLDRFVRGEDLENIRPKILGAKVLVESAPQILGSKGAKTYVVLFQNNMELRPTGGFIGSFALVTFDSGRLIDINVMDVYSADGQLKGHVEPPAPIKNYLGEANWFLRDSNWDPDFPTSAARAQWFLDKEIDKQTDGVVALDLEVAKGILAATGPVVLNDFNQVFDYKNLYERLQSEVESDFFPGSQKKANILTALSRELTTRLSTLTKDKYLPVSRQIAAALEERHIQIYFNTPVLQKAVSEAGYSGELSTPVCGDGCFADWVAPVDANVGVTKANYFISRDYKLGVVITEGAAVKTLEITYKNTANTALYESGRYRTYTRVFVPSDSVFSKARIENAGQVVEADLETETLSERRSGGINIEISPGQTKKLIFSWTTPIPSNLETGEYRFYMRKQAGTLSDPLTVNILTPREATGYNTNLARDFFARINF